MNKLEFVTELSKLSRGSTFLTLNKYENEHSEVANFSIVFHISYQNSLKKSIQTLKELELTEDLDLIARDELIDSFNASLNKMAQVSIEDIDDAYTRFFDQDNKYIKGVKLHTATNNLHLYGLVVHKKVLIPGDYPKKDTRRPLTKAKDALRAKCQVGRWRQFRILPEQVESIAVQNLSLLPPD